MARKFMTVMEFPDEPEWGPLEALSRLTRSSAHLPAFHADEFMHMGIVRGTTKDVVIQLYKHCDTRRYLNLDDGGHAYQYVYEPMLVSDLEGPLMSNYRQISLREALAHVDLDTFEATGLHRSFPPEEWPSDDEVVPKSA